MGLKDNFSRFWALDGIPALHLLNKALEPDGKERMSQTILSLNNPVLISIDVELGSFLDVTRIARIGIAVFNTNILQSISARGDEAITSRLLTIIYNGRVAKRGRRNHKTYLYGEPEHIQSTQLSSVLQDIVSPEDSHGQPRNVCLVGHNLKADLHMLDTMEPHIDLTKFPWIRALICTIPISNDVLNFASKTVSLRDLCKSLAVPHRRLHNVAHDALYTLQCMLGLFVKWKGDQLSALNVPEDWLEDRDQQVQQHEYRVWQQRLEVLRSISQHELSTKQPRKWRSAKQVRPPKPEQDDVFEGSEGSGDGVDLSILFVGN